MRVLESVPLSLTRSPGNPRPVNASSVDALAASMAQAGLLQPIIVRRGPVTDRGILVQGFRVIAGNHRLHAAQKLGWQEIEAFIVDSDTDDLGVELIEIDENLCRSELSAAQRASAIKRRKEIWEELHPNSGTSDSTIERGPGRPQEFAANTSETAGMTKQAINRHVARAEALGDDIDAVVGTSLDKGVELDALAKLPTDERKDLIEQAQAGNVVSARKRKEKNGTAAFFPAWCLDKLGEIADRFESDANCGVDEAVDKLVKLVDWNDRAYVARLREVAKFYAAIASVADVAEAKAAA